MGTVTAIEVYRAAKAARARVRAEAKRTHPSLRWLAGDDWKTAHRQVRGQAACGVEGSLTLATRRVPLCVTCYPQGATRDA